MKTTKKDSRINTGSVIITDRLGKTFEQEAKRFSDELFKSTASSPISELLELISKLPEIRQEKVTVAKRRIANNAYETQGRLDIAIDKVLEEIITEN